MLLKKKKQIMQKLIIFIIIGMETVKLVIIMSLIFLTEGEII